MDIMTLKSRRTLLFIIAMALLAGSVQAATWLVPGDAPSIQAGIDSAALGDTVLVSCGTYLEHDIIMKGGIYLLGESEEPGCVVIDAEGQGRVMDCLNLSETPFIRNLTFTGGQVSEGWFTALGGGVRSQLSSVSFTNCIFEGNTARIGAGLGASESTLTLVDCTFSLNAAEHFEWAAGGALWARDSQGTIDNCLVTANTAFSTNPDDPGDGGGFFFNNCRLDVSHSRFEDNSTGAGAGAFYSVTTDSSSFSFCDFIDNSAANGGAVYFEYGAAAQLSNCTFRGNVATAGGAIVIFNESYPLLTECLFENNQATLWGGGAIDCWSSNVEIDSCIFRNNSASTNGGGANFGGSQANIENSLFDGNTANNKGGGIRCHYADVTTTGCTLVGNEAATGAGIHCGVQSTATVSNTLIAFSTGGEAMVGLEPDFATISCSDFFSNSGGDWTGD
nr:right-handed parallel beta-helix repeat-containing protein [Candidatus Krumholzibacteria bacterium]